MNAQTKVKAEVSGLALLREPFAQNHISKLPKPTKAQTEAVRADYKKGVRCKDCGAWHHPEVVHLDYVGHAAVTDRLLDTDPTWSWEPVAVTDLGLPAFDQSGGLWIKLTVCGVTRLGYGHAAGKPNQDPGAREKEVIGDALRNAGMRFGMALDLWHKGQLHTDDTDETPATKDEEKVDPSAPINKAQFRKIQDLAVEAGVSAEQICKAYKVDGVVKLPAARFDEIVQRLNAEIAEKVTKKRIADEFGDVSEADLAA